MALLDFSSLGTSSNPKQSFLQGFDEALGSTMSKAADFFKGIGQQVSSLVKGIQQNTEKGIGQAQQDTSRAISATPIAPAFNQVKYNLSPAGIKNTLTKKYSPEEMAQLVIGSIGGADMQAVQAAKTGAFQAAKQFFKPVETRIAQEGGLAGEEIMKKITSAFDKGEVAAGKRMESFIQSGISKIPKAERLNLMDVFEGRASAISDKVSAAYRSIKPQLDEIAQQAKNLGVQTKEKTTLKPTGEIPTGLTPFQRQALEEGKKVAATIKRPFEERANFFPHVIPSSDELGKGLIRNDVAENIVRQGIKPDLTSASQFIDDYRNFIDSGAKKQSLIDYMVKTGQATDDAEALLNLQRYRSRVIKRQGSLEFARQADLPFYDPDPARVIPEYLVSTSKRLAQIGEIGQNQEVINKLINKVREGGYDADSIKVMTDRILELNKNMSGEAKLSTFLRTLQGFKLGLAAIPNITQGGLNTLLAGDLKAVGAGIKGLLTKEGQSFARSSGATLESTIRESLRQAGGDSGVLGKYLRATGFTATETWNRVLAANGGRSVGTRLFQTIQKNPANKDAVRRLSELGVNVENALKVGKLSEDDILLMAKKFSDITQFRSGIKDLPLFSSTPTGKVFFQFKNYIYGQTRLVYHATISEFKSGNWGRGVRNLVILSTVFPLTGEAIADVRSIITGRKRTTEGLARYFDNIAQVGALGMLGSTLQSAGYGQGVEALAGPTISDIGQALNISGSNTKARDTMKFLLQRVPVAGQVITPRIYPSKAQQKEQKSSGSRFNP